MYLTYLAVKSLETHGQVYVFHVIKNLIIKWMLKIRLQTNMNCAFVWNSLRKQNLV